MARGKKTGPAVRADDKIRIVFLHPLPPKDELPPKGEAVPIPNALMGPTPGDELPPAQDLLEMSEHFFLLYLIWQTYGEHRLELQLSYGELATGAKKMFPGERRGATTLHRGFTKPRIARALAKFERLGYLKVESPRAELRLVAPPAMARASIQ